MLDYGVKLAESGTSTRILAVRLGAMGDIIHTLPAVASLKHSFPGSRVTWAVHPRWAMLLAGNPFVDRLLLLDRRGGDFRRMWRDVRAEPFDFAVDFQGLIKSALVACLARTERIYGLDPSLAREPLAALFYSDKIAARAAHRVDRNLEIAAGAGAATLLRSFPLPTGRTEGSLPAGPFVLASPLSGWAAKQWPLEAYAKLAARLRREAGMPLVLNGPPAAHATLAAVTDAIVHVSSIDGLIDATRRASGVVGGDSGPLHLAAALGRPGVAIYGPTDPAQTGPYGASFTVLRSPGAVTSYKRRDQIDASMRAITPDGVFDALQARLAGRTRAADCVA
ncbi:MAG TPA: glycosyltransferase family 9 protein [Bryobacteraceae bacterium]|nr:glycosyltransferase family 9 protein [Bryobacteraceae bacterium]